MRYAVTHCVRIGFLFAINDLCVFQVLDDPTDFAICLVLEYLSGGPVMEFDKESKTFKWGKCMLQGIQEEHIQIFYHGISPNYDCYNS